MKNQFKGFLWTYWKIHVWCYSLFIFSTEIATFPSFTFCPDYFNAYKKDILSSYNITVAQIRNKIKFPQTSNMTLAQFFDLITHKFEDIVDKVIIATGQQIPHTNNSYFVFTNSDQSKIPGKYFKLIVLNQSMTLHGKPSWCW